MFSKGKRPWNYGTKGLTGRKRTGEMRECAHCLSAFYVNRSTVLRHDPKFCSAACYLGARWGESHREERTCVVCGGAFAETASATRVCCGEDCRIRRFSEIRRGDRSHFWRGGKTAPYVGVWQSRRGEALERDGYLCVTCGSDDRIQVHHIIPYRYSRSHELANLKTLCRSCHSREEYAANPIRKSQLDAARLLRGH